MLVYKITKNKTILIQDVLNTKKGKIFALKAHWIYGSKMGRLKLSRCLEKLSGQTWRYLD